MSRTTSSRSSAPTLRAPTRAIVQLWLLGLAVRTSLIDGLGEDWPEPLLRAALKVPEREARNAAKLRARLAADLAAVERDHDYDDVVSRNLAHLGERLKLMPAERAVLALAAYADSEKALQHALRVFEDDDRTLSDALAVALGHSPEEIRHALRVDGTLRGARMLRREPFNRYSLRSLTLAPALAATLRQTMTGADELLARFFGPASAEPILEADDFPHLARDIEIAVRLLQGAIQAASRGVNVLLYGPPGMGKTELSRVIAKRANAALYEVSVTEEDGDPADGSARLTGYAFCQRALRAASAAIVLFDEVEDALPRKSLGSLGLSRETKEGKGWLCRMLEENAVPSIWISNGIDHIDPAYLRRFMFVIEVPPPPLGVRRRILNKALGEIGVADDWLTRLAMRSEVIPAQVEHARRVVSFLKPEPGSHVEAVLDRVLDSSIEALGGRSSHAFEPQLDVGAYDTSYVNSSLPLPDVVRALTRSRRASMLLYGPPGTGKTGFVAHLGAKLGVPVLAKRVSDLQSSWVGQTERNLADAFREARREGAILFLDEADGFFQSRTHAMRTWEVTQVNELLVQMEAFDGIFIVTAAPSPSVLPAPRRAEVVHAEAVHG